MTFRLNALAATGLVALAGCAGGLPFGAGEPAAVARLSPTSGHQAQGSATFTARPSGVRIAGEVRGLRPNSAHGFHVHEKGDCSAPDATSAGGHFNPTGSPHGHPARPPHHAGDLPNLQANANGVARFDFVASGLSLTGPTGVLGRGLVVHQQADDYRSQPAGDSGPRIACGVITRT